MSKGNRRKGKDRLGLTWDSIVSVVANAPFARDFWEDVCSVSGTMLFYSMES